MGFDFKYDSKCGFPVMGAKMSFCRVGVKLVREVAGNCVALYFVYFFRLRTNPQPSPPKTPSFRRYHKSLGVVGRGGGVEHVFQICPAAVVKKKGNMFSRGIFLLFLLFLLWPEPSFWNFHFLLPHHWVVFAMFYYAVAEPCLGCHVLFFFFFN